MELGTIIMLSGIIAVCGAVGVVLVVARRQHYMVYCVLALYGTVAVFGAIPQEWISSTSQALLIFIATLTSISIVLPFLVHGTQRWQRRYISWQFMFFSVAVGGMALSIILPFLMRVGVAVPFFSQEVLRFFTVAPAQFLWMVAPLIVSTILRRH